MKPVGINDEPQGRVHSDAQCSPTAVPLVTTGVRCSLVLSLACCVSAELTSPVTTVCLPTSGPAVWMHFYQDISPSGSDVPRRSGLRLELNHYISSHMARRTAGPPLAQGVVTRRQRAFFLGKTIKTCAYPCATAQPEGCKPRRGVAGCVLAREHPPNRESMHMHGQSLSRLPCSPHPNMSKRSCPHIY